MCTSASRCTTAAPRTPILHLLPTLWFRNTWSWGRTGEKFPAPPSIRARDPRSVIAEHETLGRFVLECDSASTGDEPTWLFTGNDTNHARLYGGENASPHVKDAFHDYVVRNDHAAVNAAGHGTKVAALFRLTVPASGRVTLRLRLRPENERRDRTERAFTREFDETIARRIEEADAFYASRIPDDAHGRRSRRLATGVRRTPLVQAVLSLRQSPSGSREIRRSRHPPPSASAGETPSGQHLYNADVISMPDAWEYPWYAAWDLAFHALPLARIDSHFAKEQLLLLLREWYMHPNGQIPAYEFAFGDVNPPVHAWAVWRVYKMSGARGERDLLFLERAFHKLMLNFTWWVNRKDPEGNNLFGGGFLGLDNIGVFDRSQPLPTGGHLEQADGTAWMAFYCATMLSMAMELARTNPAYDDVASKFFEHFVAIADAMNATRRRRAVGRGRRLLLRRAARGRRAHSAQGALDGGADPALRLRDPGRGDDRRAPGLLQADELVPDKPSGAIAGTSRRASNRTGTGRCTSTACWRSPRASDWSGCCATCSTNRSSSRPTVFVRSRRCTSERRTSFVSAPRSSASATTRPSQAPDCLVETPTGAGPIWFPLNYLLIEALERYAHFYGDGFTVECPVGSGTMLTLDEVARELSMRLARLFLPSPDGHRPVHGGEARYATEEAWSDLVLFYEYFHGDTGRGVGASHQTGMDRAGYPLPRDGWRRPAQDRHHHPRAHGNARDAHIAARRVTPRRVHVTVRRATPPLVATSNVGNSDMNRTPNGSRPMDWAATPWGARTDSARVAITPSSPSPAARRPSA